MSELEDLLAFQIRAHKLPEPVREYRFAAKHVGIGKGLGIRLEAAGLRDWRFDFSWPDLMLAVEVEGGTWISGAHTRGGGFERDCIKYGSAQLMNWAVYRCTGGMVRSGKAISVIADLIKMKKDAI